MKKINILVLLLLGSPGVAQAEWESISMSSDATFAEYINRASTRKTPHGYKVWELLDFKTLQQGVVGHFRSIKLLEEYDCTRKRGRTLSAVWYSGQMGTGTVADNGSVARFWEAIVPDSTGEIMFNAVCRVLTGIG